MRYRLFGPFVLAPMLMVLMTVSPSTSHDTTACIPADAQKAKKECPLSKGVANWRMNWGTPGPVPLCAPSPVKHLPCKGGANYLPYQHPADADGPWWVFGYEGD
jgi:hypothetical protein